MTAAHERVECRHGALIRQCRCAVAGKPVRVESPCPPSCEADQMPSVDDETHPQFPHETKLNGATEPGDLTAYPATPGEFAARWNTKTEEQRAAFVRALAFAGDKAALCMQLHDGRRYVPTYDSL